MKINWNEDKNKLLKEIRNVSFEEAEEEILHGRILNQFKNPNYENQIILILKIDDYICQVPAVINNDEIFLKTIFKSRKYNKVYKN